jgi:hypothetical protein
MRLIIGISLLLVGVGSLSCRMESTPESARPISSTPAWVRTVDGWERPSTWLATTPNVPLLHPVIVAAGQGLASILALAAFNREDE